ncbi:MAG: tRNA-processing ribonuclease, partial [Propionibacterium sp. DORA_15]
MPRGKPVWRPILKGSLAAGFALALLQVGAGYLVQAFSSNKAVQAFGSVIIIMLVFDLIARLSLFIASWIATANQPAV